MQLRLEPLAGAGRLVALTDLAARPLVVVFWRADCGPCLIELRNRAGLMEAAGGRLVFVGLQPAGDLRAGLKKQGVSPAGMWRGAGDPARILSRFGGPPPRLPLAVALSADGTVCGRHAGLLGTDHVQGWMADAGCRRQRP